MLGNFKVCVSDDGLSPKFHVFFLLRLFVVHFALLNVVFCFDFNPFFYILLFRCQVFFLCLFIYFFVVNKNVHVTSFQLSLINTYVAM